MKKTMIYLIAVICIAVGTSTCMYAQQKGSFTDARNSKVYLTVKIGDQVWMGENLAFKTENGCWVYDDVEGYVDTYGYLYSWETAAKVCSEGWHLPSHSEFQELSNSLGGDAVAGGKLKETGTAHWNSPNAGATNSSGFTALSGGISNDYESNPYLGMMGYFWTSEDMDTDMGVAHALYSAKGKFTIYGIKKDVGISVRCLKD